MKITLIGCGNMGMIYARAFLKYSLVKADELLLVEKSAERVEELKKLGFGKVVTPDDDRILESELILLAVKPQDFKLLAQALAGRLTEKNVVLSIMAGTSIAFIEEQLNHHAIVRAMPNSPASLGMGVTAIYAHPRVEAAQLRKAENVLSTTGRTVYVDEESQMDAVTALSGSGPAYFFYLVKNMIEAGNAMGLEEGVSAMLVKQTMLGAFHLINQADKNLDELIKAVASKGGTTEAALNSFEMHHLGEHLQEGILQAEKRAQELSNK
ncbi:MAG: pyrroline-5-carboxylate reductase [Bacteroidia bacterium]